MQAQSAVNKMNYHLLGNRVAGETRRSRMARVNNRTSYQPSLTNQPASPQLNIRGAKPLNLGTTTSDMLVYPFAYGAAAFLANFAIRSGLFDLAQRGKKSVTRKNANTAAIVATLVGTGIPTIRVLNEQNGGESSPLAAAGILALGAAAPTTAGKLDVFSLKEVPKGRKRFETGMGALTALPLAAGVAAQGMEGFLHMAPAVIATLAGIKASSMLKPAKRK